MEDDLPPSYGSLFNEHKSGISYIDFLPYGVREGIFNKPKCDRFEKVIDSANQWLSQNPRWEIKTCESVEFKDKSGHVIPSKMSYFENTGTHMSFIRGLRLWMTVFPEGEERVQKIGYVNVVPEIVHSGDFFSGPKYETLDDVLLRFNNATRTSPLPGRIITVETQAMKVKVNNFIDPDQSRWTENHKFGNKYLNIIRIFYEVGDPLYEEIGITDFMPKETAPGDMFGCAQYECFSPLFERASAWCSCQSDIRICNIQSLATKNKRGRVDPRRMSYTENEKYGTSFVRTVRIVHIRQQPSHSASQVQIGFKTFVPERIESGNLFSEKFETLQETMQKVSNWVQTNNVEVLSMETSVVRLSRKGAIYSSEKTHHCDGGQQREQYIFIIRAYLKGLSSN